MQEIDIGELLTLRKEDPNLILLDCRGPDYWRWERIPSASNLRWKYIADRALKEFPDLDRRIATYCDGITCPASTKAYEELVKLGYRAVLEFSGGLSEWKAHGHPTAHDPTYKIADNVYAFPDQRFYGSPVNCYLVEAADRIILIDGPQQLSEEHEDFVLNFGKPVDVILTHAPTGASATQLRERLNARIWLHKAEDQQRTFDPDKWLTGGESFGSHLSVVHTPGHSAGSITIVDTRNQILFTGDHVAGDTDGSLMDVREDEYARGSLQERLKSLSALLAFDFHTILPFHYEPLRFKARLALENFLEGAKYGKN